MRDEEDEEDGEGSEAEVEACMSTTLYLHGCLARPAWTHETCNLRKRHVSYTQHTSHVLANATTEPR